MQVLSKSRLESCARDSEGGGRLSSPPCYQTVLSRRPLLRSAVQIWARARGAGQEGDQAFVSIPPCSVPTPPDPSRHRRPPPAR
ncbi:hypothetical protein E2562_038682 [Oryza meyeriana var. granulata]|uniref:Uncharacterized protein n=1 Tax=Oryza meyeriana var. granulata TaxID=110450 RepID=A0A6G1CM85_9ORYZ|nr:hypothetical protein E2562_038682 [Oryza meyeriana var. granulata]